MLTSLLVPLLPFIRDDFALDYTQSGLLLSAFTLSYGISQVPAGWLTDRIGPRVMITMSISGVAVAGLLVGLSQTYIMMVIFLVLMGLLGGGYHPASSLMISASVDATKRGWALGLHLIGGSASHFMTPLIAAATAATWNWRGSFIGLAVPTIMFGIIFHALLGRLRSTMRAEDKATSDYIEIAPTHGNLRRLVAFIILAAFAFAVMISTISFIPLYLVDHFGVSKEAAAAHLALFFSGGLWAGPLGGYLSDRWGRISVIVVACLIAGPVIYLLNLVPYGLALVAVIVALGIVMYIQAPVAQAYVVEHTSVRNRSTILGVYFFGGMEGSSVMAPIVGHLIDEFGFYLSFTVLGAILVIVTLGCSVFLWRR